jgi:hypothetical protein
MLPWRLIEVFGVIEVVGVKSKDAHEQDSATSKLRRGEDDNGSRSCAFRHSQVLHSTWNAI